MRAISPRQKLQRITRHFPYWARPYSLWDAVMFGMGVVIAVGALIS
jgi:hypothetical protein